MEVIHPSCMSVVNGPRFTDIKECCDYYSLVNIDLSSLADVSSFLYIGFLMAKCTAGFDNPTADLISIHLLRKKSCPAILIDSLCPIHGEF